MKTAGVTQSDSRYDLGAEKVVTYATGKSSLGDIATALTVGIAAEIFYNPSALDRLHPLLVYEDGYAQCSGNSKLLDHLSHGVGIATRTTYSWGGNPTLWCFYHYTPAHNQVSLRFILPANDLAAPNPHFRFHAVSEIGGAYYDPSYGTVGMATAVTSTAILRRWTGKHPLPGGPWRSLSIHAGAVHRRGPSAAQRRLPLDLSALTGIKEKRDVNEPCAPPRGLRPV